MPADAAVKGRGPKGNPWAVVVPMAAIVLLLMAFFWASKYLRYCEVFPFLKFVYPLIFGTAGVVLGGQISLKGKLNEQFPWAISASAGIAAALVGFAIVAMSDKPACDGPAQYTLVITDLPAISPKNTPPSIIVPEYDTDIGAVVTRANSSTKDLKFIFDGKHRFSVQLYILKLNDKKEYEYYATCNIQFEVDGPSGKGTTFTIAKDGSAPRFTFDGRYLQRLAETSKNGKKSAVENACLKAQVVNGDGNPELVNGPLYIEIQTASGPKITFVRDTGSQTANANDAQHDPDLSARAASGAKIKTVEVIKSVPHVRQPKEKHIATLSPAAALSGTNEPKMAPPQLSTEQREKILQEIRSKNAEESAPAVVPEASSSNAAAKTRALVSSTLCASSPNQSVVDRYVGGDDLNLATRKKLYRGWDELHCYVISILADSKRASADRARAIKLLTYGLANSDGGYWQPDGSAPRDFGKAIPYLQPQEINLLFELVQSDDDVVREQVLRLVRALPLDSLERLFRTEHRQIDSVKQPPRERLAIAASFLYYNRIVDYLNGDSDLSVSQKADIRKAIENEMTAALPWTNDALFTGNNGKSYRAMLYYAMGIVEREKQLSPDLGKARFSALLNALRKSADGYPTNYLHIAQALAIVDGGDQRQAILEKIKKAEWYAPAVFFDDTSNMGRMVDLFAGPGDDWKLKPQLKLSKNIRLLMHLKDWDLVHGDGQIGWMRRPQHTASR
jgi:hypothetical protein